MIEHNITASRDDTARTATVDKEGTYLHFAPAVRLGNTLAVLERFRGKSWAEIEEEARQMWEQDHQRLWDEYRVVVREAWEETRPQFTDDVERREDATTFEAAFHRHYESAYAKQGYHYHQCAPAYHCGYSFGADKTLQDKLWPDIELQAQAYWQGQNYAFSWEDMQAAVQFAWQEVRRREREGSW